MLVKFQPGAAAADISRITKQNGSKVLNVIPGLDVHVLQVPVGSVKGAAALYRNNPNVIYAEPDFYRVLTIPNEGQEPSPSTIEYFNEQWALHNTGQPHTLPDPLLGATTVTGKSDADIDAPEGWDISEGSASVKIAILDTGIDCRSSSNPTGSKEFETPENANPGKCIEEISFVTSYSNTLRDIAAHGSHVAGIAAAQTNNDIGIAGVGWNSSVGNLKTCFEYEYDLLPPLGYYVIVGICPVSSSAAAITYAADNDYHVINMSYASDEVDEFGEPAGLGGWSQVEFDAVQYAWNNGVVLVAAAGNNNDTVLTYPAAYDEVIAVGATDRNDNLASFSSFGSNWVSLLAPGDNIISTVPNDLCFFYAEILGFVFDDTNDACLDWYSGTSMASPHVAGAAALVWEHFFAGSLADPGTCSDSSGTPCNVVVRQQLENGADTRGAFTQDMKAWSQFGRLNVAGALLAAPPEPPEPPELLKPQVNDLTNNQDGTATIQWSDSGTNASYTLQREKQNKRGAFKGLTTVQSDYSDTSYLDTCGSGTFHYRVGVRKADNTILWGNWSGEIDVTDDSGGGDGGKGNGKGGGKGGGKPPK